jgi:hypothetical protein
MLHDPQWILQKHNTPQLIPKYISLNNFMNAIQDTMIKHFFLEKLKWQYINNIALAQALPQIIYY